MPCKRYSIINQEKQSQCKTCSSKLSFSSMIMSNPGHTFSGKTTGRRFHPRPSQASRASSARIRLFRQRAFARRSAFWKTSTSLPVSWRPLPLFHVSFPARTFRRKPSPEPMPVFFSFSFYFFYRVCSLRSRRHSGRIPPSPSGNAAYLLYTGSLVH